ncbi:hypothetical protein NDA15_006107 [Ustilago hordei]|nr:hypothetical protein NDA15_006107 [Ustilago hordei]
MLPHFSYVKIQNRIMALENSIDLQFTKLDSMVKTLSSETQAALHHQVTQFDDGLKKLMADMKEGWVKVVQETDTFGAAVRQKNDDMAQQLGDLMSKVTALSEHDKERLKQLTDTINAQFSIVGEQLFAKLQEELTSLQAEHKSSIKQAIHGVYDAIDELRASVAKETPAIAQDDFVSYVPQPSDVVDLGDHIKQEDPKHLPLATKEGKSWADIIAAQEVKVQQAPAPAATSPPGLPLHQQQPPNLQTFDSSGSQLLSLWLKDSIGWYHGLHSICEVQGITLTYAGFRKAFLEDFVEPNPAVTAHAMIKSIMFKNMDQYIMAFHNSQVVAPPNEITDGKWINRFLEKVPLPKYDPFVMRVEEKQVKSFQEVLQMALVYETRLKQMSHCTGLTPRSSLTMPAPAPTRPPGNSRFRQGFARGMRAPLALSVAKKEGDRPSCTPRLQPPAENDEIKQLCICYQCHKKAEDFVEFLRSEGVEFESEDFPAQNITTAGELVNVTQQVVMPMTIQGEPIWLAAWVIPLHDELDFSFIAGQPFLLDAEATFRFALTDEGYPNMGLLLFLNG